MFLFARDEDAVTDADAAPSAPRMDAKARGYDSAQPITLT